MCAVLDKVENRGIGIGEQNAKNQMILNMVHKDYPVEDIAEIADVTVEYVVKIKDGELQMV